MAFAAAQSQSSNVVLYVAVGLYVALLTVIAKLAHRRKQKEAAAVGQIKAHFSGSYGTCTLMLTTFSTIYSGYTVTGIPDEAFARGFVSVRWIGATLVIVAGMLLLYPRLRRLAVERSYTSPLDFIADRFGTLRLRVFCAICGVIPMVLYIAAQMLAFAAMVEGMTLQVLPKEASMLLFCAMILTLEMLGGMNSVVFTDVVQCSVMIVAFLMTPFVLGAEYGFLPEIAPADCGSLMRVAPTNATDAHAAPEACWGPGCVPAGCIAAVRPEFYKFPSRSTLCDIIFFLMNMLAAPMTPHMLQRAYIAKTDFDLRFVIGAMLVAPFIAQPPGIVIGLVKAAYDPAWPFVDQEATAFSGVMAQLKLAGPLQYAFVLVTTCCALAAIMSTADSALMGVSSVISNDFLKGILCPSLSTQNVVRAGSLASVCTCMVAFLLGTFLSSDELGAINSFNGGMLMQMLPAFGMGLYTQVSERTVTLGMGLGLSSLLLVVTVGNPLEGYVPAISLAALINFLTVALAHPLAQLLAPGAEAQAEEEAEGPKKAKTKLEVAEIRKVMASSREPKLGFVALMLALALGSSPWYGSPNEQEIMILGFPRWALAQLGAFLVVFGVGLLAEGLWRPPPPPPPQVAKGEEAEDRESALGSGQEEGALQGVAPEAPAKC